MTKETRNLPRVVTVFHDPRRQPSSVQRKIDSYTCQLADPTLGDEEISALVLARGRLYFLNRNYHHALADFVMAERYRPLSFDALAIRAMIHYGQGHHREVRQSIQRMLTTEHGSVGRQGLTESLSILRVLRENASVSLDVSLRSDVVTLIAAIIEPPVESVLAIAGRNQAYVTAVSDALSLSRINEYTRHS